MKQITENQYESLVNKIYNTLMRLPYYDADGTMQEIGMGEMGETHDEAERIIDEWINENNIEVI